MNRDDIIRMAREAGFNVEKGYLLRITGIDEDLERFAALVASAERERLTYAAMKAAEKAVNVAIALEREACAKECEGINSAEDYYGERPELVCAEAIRARGQA